ncbi:MAG: histidinol-phosphatase [Phycisphaerae bacterium]|nr:histidinol-phosphatase [Phycisphaerae bacterium]
MTACLTTAVAATVTLAPPAPDPPLRWWKGNTHTHTYWSDGNAAPEHIVDWYVRHGYHFLVLSDHNILSQGEKWFPISEDGGRPLRRSHVEDLERRFGPGWVDERDDAGTPQMRLKNLPELRSALEHTGAFILIQGEEITDRFEKHEVHVNGLNLAAVIPPQGGDSVRETIQRNIDAVIAHGRAHDRSVLAHLNHPNFQRSLTPEDVAAIRGERFFEVYNGHRGVLNHGDASTIGTEMMWDTALTLRLTTLRLGLLYGLATDDAHDHHGLKTTSTPGRGWVWVQAASLAPDAIIDAMRAGRFYASSGVTLESVRTDDRTLQVAVAAEPGVTYTTEFIGTRLRDDAPVEVGAVLLRSTGARVAYRMDDDVLYVRARVVASRLHPNPFAEGDRETAWVQPVLGPAAGDR